MRHSAPLRFEATAEFARRRDAADPLKDLRTRFALPHANGTALTYLCGHSLGLQPLAARTRVLEELEDWARLGVLGHEQARRPWIAYHELMAAGLERLTGARPGEVVAMNSLTINLHLMLASFYRPAGERTRIVMEAGAFASDRHAVAAQIAWHALEPRTELVELSPDHGDLLPLDALEEYLAAEGAHVALVLWPGVQYRTGQAFDLARITRAVHGSDAIVGFDLAHSIGNLPLTLHEDDADFAVWCSYKYLNAGPGAIGGCFVHQRHAASTAPRLAGWWGHDPATRFAMRPDFQPSPGAQGWQVSNPPILASAPLLASLELFDAVGMEALRAKSQLLTGYLEFLLRPLAVQQLTPADPEERGCQLSVRLAAPPARARSIFERLGARGAVCDWREPDVIRVAPVPLYNSFEDVHRFATLLGAELRASP